MQEWVKSNENGTKAEFDTYYKGLTGNEQKVRKHSNFKVNVAAYTFVLSALETSGKGTGIVFLHAVFHPCTDMFHSLTEGCHCRRRACLIEVSIKSTR